MTILDRFYDSALRKGGATMNLHGECPVTGYMVGAYPDHERRDFVLTMDALEKYVSAHYVVLARPDHYLGLWFDDGKWVYDVSIWVEYLGPAETLAREKKQEAIYALSDGDTIFINY